MLVALSLASSLWVDARRVFIPTMGVALVFGVLDGIGAAGFKSWIPGFVAQLPLADQSLGWLLPVLAVLLVAAVLDRLLGAKAPQVA